MFKEDLTNAEALKVLHVTPCYYPATGWGGPIFSTKAICDKVSAHSDIKIRVLTTNTAGPRRGQNLQYTNETVTFDEGYEVYYGRRIFRNSVSMDLFRALPSQIDWADIVHLTATYNSPTIPTLLLAKLKQKPVVWSPRGALQATAEWPDAPSKKLKWTLEQICRLARPKDTTLHVTAEIERDLSLTRIPNVKTAIISNSVHVPDAPSSVKIWRPEGRVRLMFLSRVHEKKGIENLLQALSHLPENYTLDIYGGGEEGYINSLKDKCVELGIQVRVMFHGHVDGAEKSAAFLSADIFVLPTHSENFGIVVAEAMAHGIPTITTENAPWKGINDREAGHWIKSTPDALVSAITSLGTADLQTIGENGRSWMKECYSPEAMGMQFVDLYRSLVT